MVIPDAIADVSFACSLYFYEHDVCAFCESKVVIQHKMMLPAAAYPLFGSEVVKTPYFRHQKEIIKRVYMHLLDQQSLHLRAGLVHALGRLSFSQLESDC